MKRQKGVLSRRVVWLVGLATVLSIIIFGGVSAAFYNKQLVRTPQTTVKVSKTPIRQASHEYDVLGESDDNSKHESEGEENASPPTSPPISAEYIPTPPKPEPVPIPEPPPIEIIKPPLPRPVPFPPCGGCGVQPHKNIACPMIESNVYVCAIENI